MNTNLLDIVSKLSSDYGEGILDDPKRFRSFFLDFAHREAKNDKTVLMRCVDLHGYSEMKNAGSPQSRLNTKLALVQRVEADTGLDRTVCASALDVLEIAGLRACTPWPAHSQAVQVDAVAPAPAPPAIHQPAPRHSYRTPVAAPPANLQAPVRMPAPMPNSKSSVPNWLVPIVAVVGLPVVVLAVVGLAAIVLVIVVAVKAGDDGYSPAAFEEDEGDEEDDGKVSDSKRTPPPPKAPPPPIDPNPYVAFTPLEASASAGCLSGFELSGNAKLDLDSLGRVCLPPLKMTVLGRYSASTTYPYVFRDSVVLKAGMCYRVVCIGDDGNKVQIDLVTSGAMAEFLSNGAAVSAFVPEGLQIYPFSAFFCPQKSSTYKFSQDDSVPGGTCEIWQKAR